MKVSGRVFFVSMFVAVCLSLLLAWPVMALWNDVAVDKLHLEPLDYRHAWQLLILTTLLFKSPGGEK